MTTREEMATSFGEHARTYERGRPGYPAAAVTWMLEGIPEGGRVLDVGAGTGKLTTAVRSAVTENVEAVDPDERMLAQLHSSAPGIRTYLGTAERLPFEDESVDAVVMGQAWHWVDPVAGSREIGRVVRPGGALGLIWNERDLRVDWVRRLTEIMHASNGELMFEAGGPVVAAPFGELESAQWEWSREMTREDIFDLARSRSFVINASPEDRADIEQRMGTLLDEIGAVGESTVQMPHQVVAFRAQRTG